MPKFEIEKIQIQIKSFFFAGKSIKYIYEPSLGLVNDGRAENLWWSFGGNWYSPVELQKKFPFEKKDLAINVQLTN